MLLLVWHYVADAKTGGRESNFGALAEKNIRITPRDGYLRFAPHLCSSQQELVEAALVLNEVG